MTCLLKKDFVYIVKPSIFHGVLSIFNFSINQHTRFTEVRYNYYHCGFIENGDVTRILLVLPVIFLRFIYQSYVSILLNPLVRIEALSSFLFY